MDNNLGTVELIGMEFYAKHGVHTVENEIGRSFTVDVRLKHPIEQAAVEQKLDATIDYAAIYQICKSVLLTRTEPLLETLCRAAAHKIKAKYPKSENIRVKIKKMNPLVGGKATYAAVEYSLK